MFAEYTSPWLMEASERLMHANDISAEERAKLVVTLGGVGALGVAITRIMQDAPQMQKLNMLPRSANAVYDADFMRAYLDRNLIVEGLTEDGRRTNIAQLDKLISYLSPAEQRILVESGMRFRNHSNSESLNAVWSKYGGKVGSIAGYYAPDLHELSWSGLPGIEAGTIHHEIGHGVDKAMGEALGAPGDFNNTRFYSDRLGWQEDLAAYAERPGIADLQRHLRSSIYAPKDYPMETVAEMTKYRMRIAMAHPNDPARVDALLRETYPDIWERYTTQYLPQMQATAYMIVIQRDSAQVALTSNEAQLQELLGKPYGPAQWEALEQRMATMTLSEIDAEVKGRASLIDELKALDVSIAEGKIPALQWLDDYSDFSSSKGYAETLPAIRDKLKAAYPEVGDASLELVDRRMATAISDLDTGTINVKGIRQTMAMENMRQFEAKGGLRTIFSESLPRMKVFTSDYGSTVKINFDGRWPANDLAAAMRNLGFSSGSMMMEKGNITTFQKFTLYPDEQNLMGLRLLLEDARDIGMFQGDVDAVMAAAKTTKTVTLGQNALAIGDGHSASARMATLASALPQQQPLQQQIKGPTLVSGEDLIAKGLWTLEPVSGASGNVMLYVEGMKETDIAAIEKALQDRNIDVARRPVLGTEALIVHANDSTKLSDMGAKISLAERTSYTPVRPGPSELTTNSGWVEEPGKGAYSIGDGDVVKLRNTLVTDGIPATLETIELNGKPTQVVRVGPESVDLLMAKIPSDIPMETPAVMKPDLPRGPGYDPSKRYVPNAEEVARPRGNALSMREGEPEVRNGKIDMGDARRPARPAAKPAAAPSAPISNEINWVPEQQAQFQDPAAAKAMSTPTFTPRTAAPAHEVDSVVNAALSKVPEAERAAVRAAAIAGDVSVLAKLGKGIGSKLPLVGVGIAGAFVAYVVIRAEQAMERGEITPKQLAAIVTGGAAMTASQAGSIFTGFGGEEAVEKALELAGVPKQYRFGTTRLAVVDAWNGIGDSIQTVRDMAKVPDEQVARFKELNIPLDMKPTGDPVFDAYLSRRSEILREADEGVDYGAKVGKVFPTAKMTQHELDQNIRRYLVTGGSEDAAFRHTKEGKLFYEQRAQLMSDVPAETVTALLGVEIPQGFQPTTNDPRFNRFLVEREQILSNARASEERARWNGTAPVENPFSPFAAVKPLNPFASSQGGLLLHDIFVQTPEETQQHLDAAARRYIISGGTPTAAMILVSGAPFAVTQEDLTALEKVAVLMKGDGMVEGRPADGKLDAHELGMAMWKIGIDLKSVDTNHDYTGDRQEILTAVQAAQEKSTKGTGRG